MSVATRTPAAPRALWESVLTDSEASIAEQIAAGLANKQIAAMFWVTEQTVKFHVTGILRKLACSNRAEVARWWALNVLRPPSDDLDALRGLVRALWQHTPSGALYRLAPDKQALLTSILDEA